MIEFNILGKSNCAVSIILENLYYSQDIMGDFKVNIIKNMEDKTDLPYKINGLEVNEYNCLEEHIKLNPFDNNFIIGAIKVPAKKAIYNYFKDNYGIEIENYKTIIPDKVLIPHNYKMGYGCILNYGCVLAPYVELGNMVYINRQVSIGHHTKIGDFTTVNPGVNIAGCCQIGENVTIGIGANIVDGITIGNNSIIGAGSLVTKDVPANVVVYGVPAKIIREINND